MSVIVIGYFPVIHAGHEAFFAKTKPDQILVLGTSYSEQFPRLTRDIRALSPDKIAGALRLYGYSKQVSVIESGQTLFQAETPTMIVMPDEEVSRWFAKTYLSGIDVVFERTFLRYDMPAALSTHAINDDRVVNVAEADHLLMDEAVRKTCRASDWWRQIATVVARDGQLILATASRHMPTEYSVYIMGDPRSCFDAGQEPEIYTSLHSEELATVIAARDGISLQGTDFYVTTFPCGRCARKLALLRIGRLFYKEGYSRLEGQETLRQAGVQIIRVEDTRST